MYKIYINDTPLVLTDTQGVANVPPSDDKNMVARYPGNHRMLLNYIDMLEKTSRFDSVTLFHGDVEKLATDFKGHFKIIEAAGGLVLNQENKMLFIYRRDFWDLPKGKIDKGEDPPTAAVREVQEETGIENVVISQPAGETWHTYRSKKGKRILKRTYWYLMKTTDTALTPQVEEDIEIAEWIDAKAFLASDRVAYKSIEEIVNIGLKSFNIV
jgi:8-oxo-dGTP pyrophosphatase MutT (NUDIX family)